MTLTVPSLSGLGRTLRRMPASPTSVAALLRGQDGYLAFRRIVRELFQAEEAAILGAGQPGVGRENARVWAFLHLVEERFFPVYELDEYDQVATGIPFVREGWSYERFHDLDLPPGQLLLLCLCAHPYGPDSANRVPLLEACEAHVPRSLLEAIPTEGLSPDRLRERLEGTAFVGAVDFADWVWGETGTAFLDLDDEAEVWDGDWTPETVEELAGQWVRDDLRAVTPDAKAKDHFVIIDAVGVCEQDKTDARPMEKKPSVSFERLLQAVAFGNTEDDVITSIAGRLARMEHRISAEDDAKIRAASGGLGLKDLAHQLVESLDPDRFAPSAQNLFPPSQGEGQRTPPPLQGEGWGGGGLSATAQQARINASKPLCDPALRQLILDIKAKNELTIDHVSQDQVIEAGFSQAALDRARGLVQSFEQFIADHKDEITALQILYSKPYKQRLTFEAVKELADAIEKPPYLWNESQLWQAYAALEASKVKGASGKRILTDLVSLVRFAIHQDNELVPFPERVNANFKAWLATQQQTPSPLAGEGTTQPPLPQGEGWGEGGARFTPEQLKWLHMIRDHIAANLGIEPGDFEYAPFAQEGGLGKVYQLFGDELNSLIEQLNESLAA